MALAKYLFCLYHNANPDEASITNNIRHKEHIHRMIEDCTINNLYFGGATVCEIGNRIEVRSNTEPFVDVFDHVPIIREILSKQNMVLQWRGNSQCDNRLQCRPKRGQMFPPSHLAYLAYYDNKLTVDNYAERIEILKRYCDENGLSIEHLDGDYHNHRKYNIALVKGTLNSQKNDKISRIFEPYCFTVVFDKPLYSGIESGGDFKIITGVFRDNLMLEVEKRFTTRHFENVANLLDVYMTEYPERVDKERAIANNKRLIFDVRFAEQLAKEPKEHFTCLDNL